MLWANDKPHVVPSGPLIERHTIGLVNIDQCLMRIGTKVVLFDAPVCLLEKAIRNWLSMNKLNHLSN